MELLLPAAPPPQPPARALALERPQRRSLLGVFTSYDALVAVEGGECSPLLGVAAWTGKARRRLSTRLLPLRRFVRVAALPQRLASFPPLWLLCAFSVARVPICDAFGWVAFGKRAGRKIGREVEDFRYYNVRLLLLWGTLVMHGKFLQTCAFLRCIFVLHSTPYVRSTLPFDYRDFLFFKKVGPLRHVVASHRDYCAGVAVTVKARMPATKVPRRLKIFEGALLPLYTTSTIKGDFIFYPFYVSGPRRMCFRLSLYLTNHRRHHGKRYDLHKKTRTYCVDISPLPPIYIASSHIVLALS